jgi:antitoxin ParD1/3/4
MILPNLTPELEKLVQEKVTSGLYRTASEVIREALRLLKERDDRQQAALREQIQRGLTQLDQSVYREYTDDTLPALGDEIRQRGRQRLTNRP